MRSPTHSPLFLHGDEAQWSLAARSLLAAPVLMNSIQRQTSMHREERASRDLYCSRSFCRRNLVSKSNRIDPTTMFCMFQRFCTDLWHRRHLADRSHDHSRRRKGRTNLSWVHWSPWCDRIETCCRYLNESSRNESEGLNIDFTEDAT